MKETNIKGYEKICPICKIKLTSTNKKQLEWNYNIHYQSCEEKENSIQMKGGKK